jgi:hypothetical protein
MSNDGNRVLPIVGKRLQAHVGMLRGHTNRSRWLQKHKSVMTWGADRQLWRVVVWRAR